MPSIPPKKILNINDLAKELAIDKQTAQYLMEREDFPSTKIDCEGCAAYVVDRHYLEAWVAQHSKRVSRINCDFPMPKGFEEYEEFVSPNA